VGARDERHAPVVDQGVSRADSYSTSGDVEGLRVGNRQRELDKSAVAAHRKEVHAKLLHVRPLIDPPIT